MAEPSTQQPIPSPDGSKNEAINVVINGNSPLTHFSAIPEWAYFCFNRPAYRTIEVGGVLDAQKAEARKPLWVESAANVPSGDVTNGVERTKSAGEDDEQNDEDYAHLLHDVLTIYGNVSNLEYFVNSDAPIHKSPEAVKTGDHGDTSVPQVTSSPESNGAMEEVKKPAWCDKQMLVSCDVGRKVCGHKGVVHGGFIATLLDNALGYMAHFVFKRAATKQLEINFIRPLLADSFIIADVRIDSHDTQKGTCTVVGTVYSRIPEKLRALGQPVAKPRQEGVGEKDADTKKTNQAAGGPANAAPDDVWVVAVGKAIMVDVTSKWKGIS